MGCSFIHSFNQSCIQLTKAFCMCYKLSPSQFWTGNAEMQRTQRDSISQDKNPQIVQKQWAHLVMSQNSVSGRWSLSAGRKGVKDTTDMSQICLRFGWLPEIDLVCKGTWAGHNGMNISGWNKAPSRQLKRRLQRDFPDGPVVKNPPANAGDMG